MNDVDITNIVTPGHSPSWSIAEQVSVEVQNRAFNDSSNFDVSFEYNGVVYTENISETLQPWQKYVHRFKKFIDLRNVDVVTLQASVLWDSDTDPSNNYKGIGFGGYTIINESFRLADIKIFPNPVANIVSIEADQEMRTLRFYSIDGRFIRQLVVEGNQVQVDLSDLHDGIYLMSVQFDNNYIAVRRLVKH